MYVGWTAEQIEADRQAREYWVRADQEDRDAERRYQMQRAKTAIPRFLAKATLALAIVCLWAYAACIVIAA